MYMLLLFSQVAVLPPVLPPTYQEEIKTVKSGGYPAQCRIEDLLGMERNALSGKRWTNAVRSRYRNYLHKKKTGQLY